MKFSDDDDDDDRQRTNCDQKSILEPSVQVSYKPCNLQFLIISSMVIFTIYSHLCLGLLGNFFGRNNTFSLHDLYGHALAHNHRWDEIFDFGRPFFGDQKLSRSSNSLFNIPS